MIFQRIRRHRFSNRTELFLALIDWRIWQIKNLWYYGSLKHPDMGTPPRETVNPAA